VRQIGVIDAAGRSAAWSGKLCTDWFGQVVEPHFAVQGNMLVSAPTIESMAEAFRRSEPFDLAERLMLALEAGEAAGGDKRGKQAAALVIHCDEDRRELDLRVDDHAEPVAELRRLYEVSLERFQPFVACLAGRRDGAGVTDRDEIEARIATFHAGRTVQRA
jgi:uncharacterized Ntn-hydrolase superfamily protein